MNTLCERYIKNIQEFNDMENRKFETTDTDEYIISEMKSMSVRKAAIKKEQDDILQKLLVPFEKGEKELTEEAYVILNAFATELSKNNNTVDNGIAYRVHNFLYSQIKSWNNFNYIVETMYKLGICQWKMNRVDNDFFSVLVYEDISEYKKYFPEMTETGKNYYVRCMANQLLSYTNNDPDDITRVGKKVLAELDEIERDYPDFQFNYKAARLSTYKNITTSFSGFRKNLHTTLENTLTVLDAAQKANDLICEIKQTTMPYESNYLYLLCTAKFHAGIIDLERLLKFIDELSFPSDKYTERENYIRTVYMNGYYIEYLKLYSKKSKEEIEEIVNVRVARVKEYISMLKKNNQTDFMDFYIISFIKSAFRALPYDFCKEMILEMTVTRNRATYVHAYVVRDLCEVILEYVMSHSPEKLTGILEGMGATEIQWNKNRIRQLTNDMALLHDVGKYFCMSIISNSYRRLEDIEFQAIKRHPSLGCDIFDEFPVNKVIRDGILYHHVWHNGKGGYPEKLTSTNNQPLVDILSVADSIEAATDTIGRSYAIHSSLDSLIDEFEGFRDTRYAGFVIDAIKNPEVKQQIENVLYIDRPKIMCEACRKTK